MIKKSKALIFLALVLGAFSISSNAHAAANCAGKVKFVMKWADKCGGNLSYTLVDGNEKFFCTADKTDAALVLTAQASGADVLVRLADGALSSCSQLTDHYTTPAYVIVTPS